jgi:multicomponent Na+:H+ antiporter subunit E
MTFVFTFLVLLGFWFLLSGLFSPVLIGFAITFCLLAAYLSHDFFLRCLHKGHFRMLWETVCVLPFLAWEAITTNIDMARIILSPKMDIDPVMVEMKSGLKTDMGLTLLSNFLTVTPGTLTVDIREDKVFLVHALTKENADGVLDRHMEKKIMKIEEAMIKDV